MTTTATPTITKEMHKMQTSGLVMLKQTVKLDRTRCSASLVFTVKDPVTQVIITTPPEDYTLLIENHWRVSGNYRRINPCEFNDLPLDRFEDFHVKTAYDTGITCLYLHFKERQEVIAYSNWNEDVQFLLNNRL
jgi:hypothetical protein